MITNMMPVPGIEPELPTMSLWKYNKFRALYYYFTLAVRVRIEYLAAVTSELDIFILHKAVLVKILVEGTDLGIVLNVTTIFQPIIWKY